MERRRLRELGWAAGRLPAGSRNAIVDLPGVRVGHRTLVDGEGVRTGVTAVLAHGGNLYVEKVLGACHVVNGYGKAAGLSQLEETTNGTTKLSAHFTHVPAVASPPTITSSWLIAVRTTPTTSAIRSVRRRCSRRRQ